MSLDSPYFQSVSISEENSMILSFNHKHFFRKKFSSCFDTYYYPGHPFQKETNSFHEFQNLFLKKELSKSLKSSFSSFFNVPSFFNTNYFEPQRVRPVFFTTSPVLQTDNVNLALLNSISNYSNEINQFIQTNSAIPQILNNNSVSLSNQIVPSISSSNQSMVTSWPELLKSVTNWLPILMYEEEEIILVCQLINDKFVLKKSQIFKAFF